MLATPGDQWKEAIRLMQVRNFKGTLQYLIKWADGSVPTWVDGTSGD